MDFAQAIFRFFIDFFFSNPYIIAHFQNTPLLAEIKMKEKEKLHGISAELIHHVQKLQCLTKKLSDFAAELADDCEADIHLSARRMGTEPSAQTSPNVIPFNPYALQSASPFSASPTLATCCFQAQPGQSLPDGLTDYRPLLQRDGLLLLSWDKRNTEMGERYTAYWVTSVGIPRFYASLPLSKEDFPAAHPDHKSYAAEDGIEFYGQDAPSYVVHVAPELMMHNPQHRELRLEHIQTLKNQENTTDFNYIYLLKTEKRRKRGT